MLEFFGYLVFAIAVIAMFFLTLPLAAAFVCSVVLLLVLGSKPIWAP